MEAWRQWRPGGQRKTGVEQNETKIPLTPTGLLMEGHYKTNRCLFAFFVGLLV
jgi:hypothetical protein